ncbi:MAG: aa3-type cytochrome oxidase subunit IV [Acidimicrobiales bacterium]
MKKEWHVVLGAATFLGGLFFLYWFTAYEDAGAVMLIFGMSAYALLGSYLLLQWQKRKRVPRPEDRTDALPSDGAGEIAFFPNASIWPAGIGLGAIFFAIAMIFGTWYWLVGGIIFIGSIIGFTVEAESRRD